MKWIVDAQLPSALAQWLNDQGHDAIHTLNLPQQNTTSDQDIAKLADAEGRIVISKDSDFWDDHILRGSPQKLLIVKTGNMRNKDLLKIFEHNLKKIEEVFEEFHLVELTTAQLVVHR